MSKKGLQRLTGNDIRLLIVALKNIDPVRNVDVPSSVAIAQRTDTLIEKLEQELELRASREEDKV